MGTFILIIVGGFVCKFIYDSYLTDNTDRRFEEFRRSNPEAAARVENNQGGIHGTTPSRNKSVYRESMQYIADNNGWDVHEVEGQLNRQLDQVITSKDEYFYFMKRMQQEKGREAVERKIDPEDTTAAISFNLARKKYSSLYESDQGDDPGEKLVNSLLEKYTKIIVAVGKDNPMKGTPMEGMAYEIGINNTTEELLKIKSVLSLKYGVPVDEVESSIKKAEAAVRKTLFE